MENLMNYGLELLVIGLAIISFALIFYFRAQRLRAASRLFKFLFAASLIFLGVRSVFIFDFRIPEENSLAEILPDALVRPTPIPVDFEGRITSISPEGVLEIDGTTLQLTEESQQERHFITLEGEAEVTPMEMEVGDLVTVEATQLRDEIFIDRLIYTVHEEPLAFDTSGLFSDIAYLVELDRGRVLIDTFSDTKMFPASMTKVMTALVGLERLESLDEPVLINADFNWIMGQGLTTAEFLPGAEVPAIDVLYGIMLPSGADASLSIANHISGSSEAFVELMNAKAQELGMTGTHFTNPIGDHDEDHYTTPADMVKLLSYALQNETFKRIFMTDTYRTEFSTAQENTLRSTLFNVMTEDEREENLILGGRTGFTNPAGRCLISFTEINGKTYILVTGRAFDDAASTRRHIDDHLNIYRQLKELTQ